MHLDLLEQDFLDKKFLNFNYVVDLLFLTSQNSLKENIKLKPETLEKFYKIVLS